MQTIITPRGNPIPIVTLHIDVLVLKFDRDKSIYQRGPHLTIYKIERCESPALGPQLFVLSLISVLIQLTNDRRLSIQGKIIQNLLYNLEHKINDINMFKIIIRPTYLKRTALESLPRATHVLPLKIQVPLLPQPVA